MSPRSPALQVDSLPLSHQRLVYLNPSFELFQNILRLTIKMTLFLSLHFFNIFANDLVFFLFFCYSQPKFLVHVKQ